MIGFTRIVAIATIAMASAAGPILGASCVGVFELDGYSDAAGALCGQLAQCFGGDYYRGCNDNAAAHLVSASEAERSGWLTAFADNNCLEDCTTSRQCLDANPVCGATGSGCAQVEQCCGFTSGAGACEAERCCRPDGIACDGPQDCCQGSCENGFCGGYACTLAGQSCQAHHECCTGVCNPDGLCADSTCLPLKGPCSLSEQCCTRYCDQAIGQCAEPSCVPEGAACSSSESCCQDYCVTADDGATLCSASLCFPVGADCSKGGDGVCCSGDCEDDKCQLGCLEPGKACTGDGLPCCSGDACNGEGECPCLDDGKDCGSNSHCCGDECNDEFTCGTVACTKSGETCGGAEECCSDRCELVTKDQQRCCDEVVCHPLCAQGAPLRPACTSSLPTSELKAVPADCIKQVCEAMPSCCCVGWTDKCVTQAKGLCGLSCLDVELPVPVEQ